MPFEPAEMHPEKPPWGWLVALTLLAAVLRAVALDQQLWYDEMLLAVRWAPLSLKEIVTTYASESQHMLFSVLARISLDLFGQHNWALRLPAVLFGVATVPALYFCARRVASRRESLLAAALLAVSYHHVWFSQNARGYTGLGFWTLLTTYFFVRGMREDRLRLWIGYGVAMALGMYTHLTMGFVTAGQFLVFVWLIAGSWLYARREGKPILISWTPLWGFVASGLFTLALYAPVLPQVLSRTLGQQSSSAIQVQSEWTNPLWLVLETLRGLAAGAGGALGYIVLPVAGLILLTGLVSYWRRDRHFVGLMVLPGTLLAAVMLLLEHNLWPRFFFFAIGFGMMLLVRGAMVVGSWAQAKASGRLRRDASQRDLSYKTAGWGTALVGLMILASAWSLRSAWIYPKQDFAGALEFVESQRQAGEPVALAGLAVFPYREYYQRDWPAVATRAELEAQRVAGHRLWLVYASPIYVQSRQPEVWNAITTEFEPVRVFRGTMGDGAIYVCRSKP